MKRIFVNAVLILCFAGLGVYCYSAGKSYKILLENLPYMSNGTQHPAFEALQVTIDNQGAPLLLLEDDQIPASFIGKKHTMTIELLDQDDKVIEKKDIAFSIQDLGDSLSINAAKAFATGVPVDETAPR